MIDKEIVKSKIRDIIVYLKEIEPILELNYKDIVKDLFKLRTLERNFQLIVDTMVDINTHIISRKNLKVPDDFQSTFTVLGENKVIPMDFAFKIAPVVGMRNRVVHKYGDFDKKKFITDLKKGTTDFKEYCRYAEKYLNI